MDELIAFITARLDEDERLARVATPGHEHARLRVAVYDLIARHVADIVSTDDERTWLAAMLAADAGVSCAAAEVSRALDARARRAGMTLAAIGAARGISKQSVSKRVSRG